MQLKNVCIGSCFLASIPLTFYWISFKRNKTVYVKPKNYLGLKNHGNTCFMNAILQSLASCTLFIKSIQKNSLTIVHEEQYFIKTLLKILLLLHNKSNSTSIDPYFVLDDLFSRGWRISTEEHDAHEFFHVICMTLDEEHGNLVKKQLNKSLSNVLLSNLNQNDLRDTVITYANLLPEYNVSLSVIRRHLELMNLFQGRIGIKLVCLTCGHKNPIRYESFDSLSLTFDHLIDFNKVTLQRCLKSYFSPEKLNQVDCEGCAKTMLPLNKTKKCKTARKIRVKKTLENITMMQTFANSLPISKEPCLNAKAVKSDFKKSSYMVKYPKCLCIHLQRLTWRSGMPMKLNNHIEFAEILDNSIFEQSWYQSADTACLKRPIKFSNGSDIFYDYLMMCNLSTPYLGFQLSSLLRFLSVISTFADTNLRKEIRILKEVKVVTPLYQLSAVIVHLGGWNSSGHFVTFRRVTKGNTSSWLYISDTEVYPCSISKVLSSTAYMLFYEKI